MQRLRKGDGGGVIGYTYADDGMVASSDPRWLQWAFTTLVGLFERVGLKTNTGKTVSTTCRPCPAVGNRSEAAYGHTMTGEGLTYLERKQERVECRDCGMELAAGSLDIHRMTQHGKPKERLWNWTATRRSSDLFLVTRVRAGY